MFICAVQAGKEGETGSRRSLQSLQLTCPYSVLCNSKAGRVSSGSRLAVGHPILVILSGGSAAISEACARTWVAGEALLGQAGGGDMLAT